MKLYVWMMVQLRFARKASTFMKYCLAKVRHVEPPSRWHLQSAFSAAFEMHVGGISVFYDYSSALALFVRRKMLLCAWHTFSDIYAIVLQGKDRKCLSPILINFGYAVV